MSGYRLREATPEDIGTVWRLLRGLAEYERKLDHFTATKAGLSRVLFGPRPIARAVLAEADGQAVGLALWIFALSTFTGRPILFLEDIFVEPAYRKRGIGVALFRYLARIAKAENCFSMNWNVLDWNESAIDFYRRIGAHAVTGSVAQRLDADGIAALADE